MATVVQGVERQLEEGRATAKEIVGHLQGLEAAMKTLDALRMPEPGEFLGDVVRLVKLHYGEFVVQLGSGECSDTRARALRDIEESADGDYD